MPSQVSDATANRCSAVDCRTLIILGAGGYIGRELARYFHGRENFKVVGVFHNPPSHNWFDDFAIRDIFTQACTDLLPANGEVILVNCAFDFRAVGRRDLESRYRFVESALVALMKLPGSKAIHISSMSAHDGSQSAYGREKLFIEQLFARYHGINLRLGLVLSWKRPGSAFQSLINIVRRWPIVPVITSSVPGFFICDLDALLRGTGALLAMRLKNSHTLSFCEERPVSLRELLKSIAASMKVRRLFLPIPWRVAYHLLRVKERLGLKGNIRADSIRDIGFPPRSARHRQLYARMTR